MEHPRLALQKIAVAPRQVQMKQAVPFLAQALRACDMRDHELTAVQHKKIAALPAANGAFDTFARAFVAPAQTGVCQARL